VKPGFSRVKLQPKPRAMDKAIALSPEEIAWVQGMVIYEDAHIVVLNKPPGLSSQGGRGQVHTLDELLWAFARSSGNRPRLIHRLDRDTSGVILTARTKPAASFLGKALMAKRFRKTYRAIVAPGAPAPTSGVIETPLRRDEQGREAFMRICEAAHPDAETAKTMYRTMIQAPGAALLELQPHTGRMHQLRVHLAWRGRPEDDRRQTIGRGRRSAFARPALVPAHPAVFVLLFHVPYAGAGAEPTNDLKGVHP
jgi:23S rRNA-/tRNA-specific pseudouridylate synthase